MGRGGWRGLEHSAPDDDWIPRRRGWSGTDRVGSVLISLLSGLPPCLCWAGVYYLYSSCRHLTISSGPIPDACSRGQSPSKGRRRGILCGVCARENSFFSGCCVHFGSLSWHRGRLTYSVTWSTELLSLIQCIQLAVPADPPWVKSLDNRRLGRTNSGSSKTLSTDMI